MLILDSAFFQGRNVNFQETFNQSIVNFDIFCYNNHYNRSIKKEWSIYETCYRKTVLPRKIMI